MTLKLIAMDQAKNNLNNSLKGEYRKLLKSFQEKIAGIKGEIQRDKEWLEKQSSLRKMNNRQDADRVNDRTT